MAIAKRRKSDTATKRKPSATKKRKAKVGSDATIKLFGRTYKKALCGLTKTEATSKAVAHRAKGKGKGAAIKKNPVGAGYCFYKRG